LNAWLGDLKNFPRPKPRNRRIQDSRRRKTESVFS
jgi:hypothetical protein